MDLKTKTLEQCKSIAYDLLVQIEQLQRNLQIVNQEIQKKSTEPKEKVLVKGREIEDIPQK